MKKRKSFYKLNVNERIIKLEEQGYQFNQFNVKENDSFYDQMIENYLTTYEIPMGMVENLKINNKNYNLILATEEASIIAGINKMVKVINLFGSIEGDVLSKDVIGQIIIKNNNNNNNNNDDNNENLLKLLKNEEAEIIKIGNNIKSKVIDLGGGITKVNYRVVSKDYISLDLIINPLEAMGANFSNTVLEVVANYLRTKGFNVLTQIISNLATQSVVTLSCEIDATNKYIDEETAQKIVELTNYAKLDPHRATTHNKGVLNGVLSFIIPSGNDFRANAAGIITYSLEEGVVKPLTNWHYDSNKKKLCGEIKMPIQVGSVGVNIDKLNKVKLFKELTHTNTKDELMLLSAAAGLLSNLASLLALVTEGIQKGHMKLVRKQQK